MDASKNEFKNDKVLIKKMTFAIMLTKLVQ